MSASTSRYSGINACVLASPRDSSLVGYQYDLISSPTRLVYLLRPDASPGPERELYQKPYCWPAFISRLTSRAWAIDSSESTSATVCQFAAYFSQPSGFTSNFLARTATRILTFISPKPGSFLIRAARSAPSRASLHTARASPP